MKNVEYLGPKVDLGRFGKVKKGAKLQLTEQEWGTVKDNEDYKLLDPPQSEEELRQALKIKPWATQEFDLRSIPWDHTNLFNILVARSSTKDLRKVTSAMETVGAKVRVLDSYETRFNVVDAIIECSNYHQWHKLSREDRDALDKYDPNSIDFDNETKDSGHKESPEPKTRVVRKRARKAALATS